MDDVIKGAIRESIHTNGTIAVEIDRNGLDNASLSAQVNLIWWDMSDGMGGTDWDNDKDGGVRIWGWVGGASAECTWTIVIR